MGAVDTKVLVRLLVADDPAQTNGLLPSSRPGVPFGQSLA